MINNNSYQFRFQYTVYNFNSLYIIAEIVIPAYQCFIYIFNTVAVYTQSNLYFLSTSGFSGTVTNLLSKW